MDGLTPLNNDLQARFSLEQTKLRSLNDKLQSRENQKDLMENARKFEGVFIKQLLDAMDKTIDRSGFMSGGSGEDTFRGMMYDHMADNIATRPGGSGFGLAEAIYRQLEQRLPEKAHENPTTTGGVEP